MSVLAMIPVGELETLIGAQKSGPAQEKKSLGGLHWTATWHKISTYWNCYSLGVSEGEKSFLPVYSPDRHKISCWRWQCRKFNPKSHQEKPPWCPPVIPWRRPDKTYQWLDEGGLESGNLESIKQAFPITTVIEHIHGCHSEFFCTPLLEQPFTDDKGKSDSTGDDHLYLIPLSDKEQGRKKILGPWYLRCGQGQVPEQEPELSSHSHCQPLKEKLTMVGDNHPVSQGTGSPP